MAVPLLQEKPLVLGEREFDRISQLAYEHFGLDLRAGKQSLVAARLAKKVRQLGLRSFDEYCHYVRNDRTGKALESMIDDLTTNHTSFFREPRHFDFLRRVVLPQYKTRPQINVWSAACSSGEEPYSIAMSIFEELGTTGSPEVRILATDISTQVLARATRAIYPEERFRGIPLPCLQRHLLRGTADGAVSYRIKPELRAMVEFRHMNLMQSFTALPQFQTIFCRNVLIYFDKPTQQDLVRRLAAQLEPGGYLLVGHAESLNSIDHGLEYVQPATYRSPGTVSKSGRATR
jgi:chemotaxis protein methyltransferase CheR